LRLGSLFLLIAAAAAAQVISPIAGSSTIVAPGSLAAINYIFTGGSAQTSATVSLLPAGSTTLIPAQVVAAGPVVITYVVPSTMPTGDAMVIYKPAGQATQWARVSVVPANFSLFGTGSFNTASAGPLLAQNIQPDGSAVLNGLATPAQSGQPVVLWGTGLGATPQSVVSIALGGVPQPVLYAGPAPGQPGLNQINFRVAAGTPDGCYVPLTVTYGTRSLTSFLSKTPDGSPCHHPFDLTLDAMKALDSGSAIETGEITLSTATEAAAADRASRQESAQVIFPGLGASNIAAFFTQPGPGAPVCSIPTLGITGVALSGIFSPGQSGAYSLTNGATTLALPWATPSAVPDAPLANLPPPILAGNKWTWSTNFDFTLPPALQIAGSAPLTLDRSRDQTIAWNGSAFDAASIVRLTLNAQYPGAPMLICSAPATTGAITLPASLLAQFAGGAAGSLQLSLTPGGTSVPHALSTQGGAPLLMLAFWTSTDARPVDFK
jgi:uncharacterized protein (TIGR03437 family)